MLAWVGRYELQHSLHLFLSSGFTPNIPYLLLSLSTHCFQVFLGLPLPLPPSTSNTRHFETQSSASFLSTCPNHHDLPFSTISTTLTIPSLHSNSSLDFPSFNETRHIALTIDRSARTCLFISSTLISHASLPYTSRLRTHTLYSFPFKVREAPLLVGKGANSLNLHQALLTLALEASSAPPPAPTISPK